MREDNGPAGRSVHALGAQSASIRDVHEMRADLLPPY